MATLQSALSGLGPLDFKDVPKSTEELDVYLENLYEQAQTVLESIPSPPEEPHSRPRSKTTSSTASSASEISSSSARSEPPPPHIASLQKDWGKPLKLKASENTLGISVYKASAKDGRGAWFARRSVHEGLGFSKFKAAFEKEFPTSLSVQGAPGEGNIRGIGAETRIEQIDVPGRGKIDVYRLSAQFPGPTTPRDFVTFLATSSKAMKAHSESERHDLVPRHYMIISKPCNHPETQPRNGFIRGSYESVEFIREVPRQLKASTSQTNLHEMGHAQHKHGHDMAHELLVRNAERMHTFPSQDSEHSDSHLTPAHSTARESSPAGRRRSHTVDIPSHPEAGRSDHERIEYDPEDNPVEWIMVTRSDPGGSVPRFMVERGTPSSICADAVKFLDWACQLDDDVQSPQSPSRPPKAFRRESFTSFHDQQHAASSHEEDSKPLAEVSESDHASIATSHTDQGAQSLPSRPDSAASGSSGVLPSVAGILSSHVPQSVSGFFSQATPKASPSLKPTKEGVEGGTAAEKALDDDAASTISSISWASADSHITSDGERESESLSSTQNSLSSALPSNQANDHQDKELQKLSQRKATLDAKYAQQREKLSKQNETATEKEQIALKKAEEKHESDLKKHEEKYQRELKKIEDRKTKEAKKQEDRKRKQIDKDEKMKLKRERDEALQRLKILEQERDIFSKQVGELQKENTALMARIGRLEADQIESGGRRSRSNSILHRKKEESGA